MNARNRVFLILGIAYPGIPHLVSVHGPHLRRPQAHRHRRRQRGRSSAPRFLAASRPSTSKKASRSSRAILSPSSKATTSRPRKKPPLSTVTSNQYKLNETIETQRQNQGEVTSATASAQAQVRAAQATLAQAQANLDHQRADTTRIVALAKQGIMSAQARDEAITSLQADTAAVETARQQHRRRDGRAPAGQGA